MNDLGQFRAAFDTYRDPLYRFLRRLTGSADDADELLQETFVTFWRKGDQLREPSRLRNYLYTIAHRKFLSYHHRRRRRPTPATLDGPGHFELPDRRVATPPQDAAREETVVTIRRRLARALDRLPPPQQEVFVLFRYENYTCREIAEITGAPLKTVESRLAAAVQKIGRSLRSLSHLIEESGDP